ncbi:44588_t:CDS:2 [Gigaspora margarita]|uniref:44588_t:CDS:1 n=1 Tax=Gigaspora margarita TaxID=4874 RepID=A0ABN7UBN1_GIGMA|nr:44588_t:CDS:2 [Gigaspora margarita]
MLRIIFGTFLIISVSRVLAFPSWVLDERVDNQSTTHKPMNAAEYWIKLFSTIVLVLLGGLFAGLTIGLMSLDETNLNILTRSEDPKKRKYAAQILPIRKNGHLLLVTLLVCNVLVNETLPIIMDDVIGSGISAILASSALILLFGEIVPQAICARYGLAIGAFFAWVLDVVLGENHGIIYRRAELKELIKYHESSTKRGGDLNTDSVTIIRGALDFQDKVAEDAITPLDKVFMISNDIILDRKTLNEIYLCGYSRIPIYDALPLKKFSTNPILTVEASTSLVDILNSFQEGKCHMALVVKESNPIGIITLEDILEELIQEEIYDESDTTYKSISGLNASIKIIRNNKKIRTDLAKKNNSSNDPKRNDLIAIDE